MKIVCDRPISYNFNGLRVRKPAGVELEVEDSLGAFLIARGDAKEVLPQKEEKPKAKTKKEVEEITVVEEVELEVSEDAISSEFE
jgi:hypothetical protein